MIPIDLITNLQFVDSKPDSFQEPIDITIEFDDILSSVMIDKRDEADNLVNVESTDDVNTGIIFPLNGNQLPVIEEFNALNVKGVAGQIDSENEYYKNIQEYIGNISQKPSTRVNLANYGNNNINLLNSSYSAVDSNLHDNLDILKEFIHSKQNIMLPEQSSDIGQENDSHNVYSQILLKESEPVKLLDHNLTFQDNDVDEQRFQELHEIRDADNQAVYQALEIEGQTDELSSDNIHLKHSTFIVSREAIPNFIQSKNHEYLLNTPSNDSLSFTIDSADYEHEVSQKIQLMLKSGETSAKINITPPELGEMEIKIVHAQEKTDVIFLSNYDATRELIEATLHQLRIDLEQQGITLGDVLVANHESNNSGFAQHEPTSDFSQEMVKTEETLTNNTSLLSATPKGLLDMYA